MDLELKKVHDLKIHLQLLIYLKDFKDYKHLQIRYFLNFVRILHKISYFTKCTYWIQSFLFLS